MEIKRIPTKGMAANSYLLVSGNEAAIVDPSAPVSEVEKLLGGARVRCILLTHCHYDHVLTLDETRRAFSAPLLVHEDEADALSDPKRSLFRTFFGMGKKFAPAERLLKDGDELPLGGESIRVISTPGHTPGSVCFLADTFVVTGDTLFAESIGRSDFPGGDRAALFRSLEKLKRLDGSLVIYPGHEDSDTLENVIKFNPYMNGEL
ncbi:MAG: MBL fold metallo-hydrolase [Clostridia bacterium]|nr:MBL fold metallo-hydrolase [Clostridia bacterium]